jgi:hypothetical protein
VAEGRRRALAKERNAGAETKNSDEEMTQYSFVSHENAFPGAGGLHCFTRKAQYSRRKCAGLYYSIASCATTIDS